MEFIVLFNQVFGKVTKLPILVHKLSLPKAVAYSL